MYTSNTATFQYHDLRKQYSPLIYYDVFRYAHGSDGKNWHNNIELLYFTSDNASIVYDENLYELKKGDIFIVSPNKSHQVFSGNTMITYKVFIIDNDFCKYNGIDVEELNYQNIVNTEKAHELAQKLIDQTKATDIFKVTKIKVALLELMLYISINFSTPNYVSDNTIRYASDSLKLSINYINAHISEKLTLDIVSHEVGISKYYFSREFKKQTGLSFVTYVNKARCKKAANLLLNKMYSVHDVAMMCGFETDSYFSKIFKSQIGLSPCDFIKSQNATNSPQ